MKSCRDFDIEICYRCSDASGEVCLIEFYKNEIEEFVEMNDTKAYILKYVIQKRRTSPRFVTALKYYYPELYAWYEKILVLK